MLISSLVFDGRVGKHLYRNSFLRSPKALQLLANEGQNISPLHMVQTKLCQICIKSYRSTFAVKPF